MRSRLSPDARSVDPPAFRHPPGGALQRPLLLVLLWVLALVACNDTAAPFGQQGPSFKGPPSAGLCAEPGAMLVPGALPQAKTVEAGAIGGSWRVARSGFRSSRRAG